MSDDTKPSDPATPPQRLGPLMTLGSIALLLSMALDTLAVIGRHIGHALLGSIELVQAAMLVAGSVALVASTLARKHASVHLLVSRLPARAREGLARISALLSALFFALLAAGAAMIAAELWHGYEQSELLNIPYAPLRIASLLAVLGVTAVLLRQALGRRSS